MTLRLMTSVLAAALALGAGPAQAGKAPPESVELYAMDCGRFDLPNADMFADDGAYKGVAKKMVVPCYLVRHPKGDLIWDTGLPAQEAQGADLGGKPGRPLPDQLKDLGLTPADIEYVSVSHSHFDHIGQAGLFAGGTWIVDPDEKAFAFSEASRKNAATFAGYSALENARTILIEQPSHDVFGDGSTVIYQTPGHTPGHTILLVRPKGAEPVLLTGDLWHIAESREHKRVPRFNVDRAKTLESYELTEKLAAETKARVVRQHVPEDFEMLPKFPEPLR